MGNSIMKGVRSKGFFVLTAILTMIIVLSLSLSGCAYYDYLDNDINEVNIAENATFTSEKGKADKLIKAGAWKTKQADNATVEISWDSPQSMNTIILEEKSDDVMDYKFEYYNTETSAWEVFYKSDKIEAYKMCTFTTVTTDKIKFTIMNAKGDPSIDNIEIYNMEKKELEEDLRVVTYLRFDTADRPTEIIKKQGDETPEEQEARIKIYADYYEVITHIILFNAVGWGTDGEFVYTDTDENGVAMSNADAKISFEAELAALKVILSKCEKTDHHISVTIINPTSPTDTKVTPDSIEAHEEKIINNIYKFVQSNNVDGVDVDWEYPNTKQEWKIYDDFINNIIDKMETITDRDVTYSSALSHYNVDLKDATINRMDFLNYMGYDGNSPDHYQSTFKEACVEGLAYFNALGFDISKINLGMPYYSRPTTSPMHGFWGFWRDYEDANYFDNVAPDMTYTAVVDGVSQEFTNDNYFNSPAMIGDKTAYVINNGVGGVMLFRQACDKLMDSDLSLTLAIDKVLYERVAGYDSKFESRHAIRPTYKL